MVRPRRCPMDRETEDTNGQGDQCGDQGGVKAMSGRGRTKWQKDQGEAGFLADMEANPLLRDSVECQRLVMEAMKYHLLPERRPLLQSPRTRPRKATVGALFAVGGMDATKGGTVVFRSSRSLCGCRKALKCLLLSIISMVTVLQYKPPVLL
ncbi:Kelch-like protein 5 [Anabarilius grahami]|uniref:Kelch-like protein 5 n=1 Tax=Anabarilius grahami TaxID=495550 RepID=A0A3N0XF64_ANAGA|nr:Kelch-like protein 5 [Anabarilius grahami]